MTVPTSGSGVHQPIDTSNRSVAEKRTSTGSAKPQHRVVASSSSSSSSTTLPPPSFQGTLSEDLRPESPLPPLISRSLVQRSKGMSQPASLGKGDLKSSSLSQVRPIHREHLAPSSVLLSPPTLIPDLSIESVDTLVNLRMGEERKSGR